MFVQGLLRFFLHSPSWSWPRAPNVFCQEWHSLVVSQQCCGFSKLCTLPLLLIIRTCERKWQSVEVCFVWFEFFTNTMSFVTECLRWTTQVQCEIWQEDSVIWEEIPRNTFPSNGFITSELTWCTFRSFYIITRLLLSLQLPFCTRITGPANRLECYEHE